jgi:3D (Asp-Asp-Asp) domain-containing protein
MVHRNANLGALELTKEKNKKKKKLYFPNTYTQINWDSVVVFPLITPKLTQALRYNEKLLAKLPNKKHHVGGLHFTTKDLRRVNDILLVNQNRSPVFLSNFLKFYQLGGNDHHGSIKFTGYYSPYISASHVRTVEYNVPVYERPENWSGALPTRQQIENQGILEGKGLEICYVQYKKDLYNLQMQGSGYVRFDDGSIEYISYDGDNRQHSDQKDESEEETEDIEKVEPKPMAIPQPEKVVTSKAVVASVVDYSKMTPAEIKKIKEQLDVAEEVKEKPEKAIVKAPEKAALKIIEKSQEPQVVRGPAALPEETEDEEDDEVVHSKGTELDFVEEDEIDEAAISANPRYIFFTKEHTQKVQGAGRVRLTEDYSIAVDRSVIPIGACLLAAVPVLKKGKITQELRFVLAQDTGGKVIGKGHIDLYTGAGKSALAKAKKLNNNGQLWLLLPK